MLPLVYFVRHGQTDWNAEGPPAGPGRHRHQSAWPRTGRPQRPKSCRADRATRGVRLRREPDAAHARNDGARARSPWVCDPFGYRTDARLIEVHFGDLAGPYVRRARSARAWLDQGTPPRQMELRPPGPLGESYEMLRARVTPWLESLAQPTVCVTHGGVIRVCSGWSGQMSERDAAALDVPQDRVLRLQDELLDWL